MIKGIVIKFRLLPITIFHFQVLNKNQKSKTKCHLNLINSSSFIFVGTNCMHVELLKPDL